MIPLFAPVRQNESFLNEIEDRMKRFIRSGEYILGKSIETVEGQLVDLSGYAHAIGCGNGTDAIVLALRALDLPAGSEVITPAFSFVASASVVVWAGLRPVFADVDEKSMNVSLETVKAALTPNTKAVIAVDLYGRRAPIDELRQFCDEKGLYLIEDGAQSLGVEKGSRGAHLFTTSFYPTKNIGAIGDGGAVMTDDPALALAVREMTRHGGMIRDTYRRVGTTSRLDTIQADVLALKLPSTKKWSEQRRALAKHYNETLGDLPNDAVKLPELVPNHVWALYTVRIKADRRAAVMEQLKSAGVGCAVYYPKALPDQEALTEYRNTPYPVAQRLGTEVLSLPLFPELTPDEVQKILGEFRKAIVF